MAPPQRLPENLMNLVLTMSGEGKTATEIADYLRVNYAVDVNYRTISQRLAKIKKERKEVAKQAYANEVAKSANQDLKILSDLKDRLYVEALKAFEDENTPEARKLSESALKFVNTSMELSGLNEKEEETNDEQTLEQLLTKIGIATTTKTEEKN